MFVQLFRKECRQTAKSLIYWIIVAVMILDFATQLGSQEVMEKPEPGQDSYGVHLSKDDDVIMRTTLGCLVEEYYRGSYATYPIGFYKNVTLDEEDTKKIEQIIEKSTGLAPDQIENTISAWYDSQNKQMQNGQMMEPAGLEVLPVDGLTYEKFEKLMDEADHILGGGSSYGKDSRLGNAYQPMTYEEALNEYNALIDQDKLTGGYARLFSDYMVIMLGILPVFLAATRSLRDRRAQMQGLIYTRKGTSAVIIASRYLSMIVMLLIPVFLLSLIPFTECLKYAQAAGIQADILAFAKYIAGWLLPTIMTATAVGMLFTELTETALAVLIQGAWWFIDVFAGGTMVIHGGMYSWHLMPRHNSELNYQAYADGFSQLVSNRILYVSISIIMIALTVIIYGQKRKGRLDIRGKILADRKSKSKA